MGRVEDIAIFQTNMTNLANSIRTKSGTAGAQTLIQLKAAVDGIPIYPTYLGAITRTGSVTPTTNNYLCFTAVTAPATIIPPQNFSYSTDNCVTWKTAKAWNEITLNNQGDKIYFKHGSVSNPTAWEGYGAFEMPSGQFAASGDVTTLLNDEGLTTLTIEACLANLFQNCTNLVQAPALPATTLSDGCYLRMFKGCTGLTSVPNLPATALTEECYGQMFEGCSNITTPASMSHITTFANSCCANMYHECTSLNTLPIINVLAYPTSCCTNMFANCSAINIDTQATSTLTYTWRLPYSGTGTLTNSNALTGMFASIGNANTSGYLNTTIYVANHPV